MIERITSGWTFIRGLYLVMGLFVIGHAVYAGEWMIGLIGVYFASMGLFNYGCANRCYSVPDQSKPQSAEIEYEEIK